MQVNISYQAPHQHFINFELRLDVKQHQKLTLQLPAWRPGRYELGNFAKYIQNFQAFDEQGKEVAFNKLTKDAWEFACADIKELVVKYKFYAAELNAGSSFLDEDQLYINPVNCIPYIVGKESGYTIDLDIPESYRVAWPLKQNEKGYWIAKDKEELYEAILIASEKLQFDSFTCEGYKINIWFNGGIKPFWRKLKRDFYRFTKEQIKAFGELPVPEYHFMFQALPHRFYHGVEHTACTICVLGPGSALMKGEGYEKLLGISSHELYHTWNIKQIRPAEMQPYDYTKENYTKLGYLAEGVTTYMGDVFLAKSNVFSWKQFVKTQEENLQKHKDNFGRYNYSVAESGFDSWLDGYELGIPNRTVSIYAEGALCMLMLDVAILKRSKGKKSLQTLITELYHNFAKKGKGVSEAELLEGFRRFAGDAAEEIIQKCLYGRTDYQELLSSYLNDLGLKITTEDNPRADMRLLGVKALRNSGKEGKLIKTMVPNSIADKAGIAVGDEILSINGKEISVSVAKTLDSIKEKSISLRVKKPLKKVNVELSLGNETYYSVYKIQPIAKPSVAQKKLFTAWCGMDLEELT